MAFAAVIAVAAVTATGARPLPRLEALSFNGSFRSSLTPWTSRGGGPQCANFGTPSKSPRLRGEFALDSSVIGAGARSGRFTLPADPDPTTYPLEACDLVTGTMPMSLPANAYYGLMVYVPRGWTIPNHFFTGVEIAEYHFQDIYGAPIALQLHPHHITLALQTGACNNHTTARPGCQWHSNADNPNGSSGNVRAKYVIPSRGFVQGAWNEILMHVRWTSDSTGVIQTWYKVMGASTWTASANVTGRPTVQWDVATGCCSSSYHDVVEAYTGAVTAPVSVWLANDLTGPSFASVAHRMP